MIASQRGQVAVHTWLCHRDPQVKGTLQFGFGTDEYNPAANMLHIVRLISDGKGLRLGTEMAKPGFEFNSIGLLQKILHRHPTWPVLHNIITMGVHYTLAPILEEVRLCIVKHNVFPGNLGGNIEEDHIMIEDFLQKELGLEDLIPVPTSGLRNVKNIKVY